MSVFVNFVLFLSGFSALVYQISWIRILGLSVGSDAFSIAIIIAVFFSGLALGSLLAQKWLKTGTNGLKGFTLAEAMVGISALVTLPVLFALDQLLVLASSPAMDSFSSFALVFLLLIIPTIGMGMTYPLLSSWLSEQRRKLGQPLSELFIFNTLGAVFGVLLAGFVLIPNFGLDGSVYIAAAMNFLSAAIGWVLYLKYAKSISTVKPERERGESQAILTVSDNVNKRFVLLALSVTGFSLMAAEILWSKVFVLYTGNTLHAFSAMLAVILVGLALGGALFNAFTRRVSLGTTVLIATLLMLSLSLFGTRFLLGWLPLQFESQLYLGEFLFETEGWLLMLVLMPSSLIFGALFPMLLTYYCHDYQKVRSHLGMAYAVNTFFGVVGAVAASLWIAPGLGSDQGLALVAMLPLMAALVIITSLGRVKTRLFGYGIVFALGLSILLGPGISIKQLLSTHYYRFGKNEPPKNFRYLSEGRTGIVSLIDYGNDVVHLQKNGLKEALIHAKHAYKGTLAESLLGALPYLLQQTPKNAFVVGFGGGTTTRILVNSGLERVKTVEIEPKVVEAMMQVGEDKFAFLNEENVDLSYNDARMTLRRESEKYSIIASQPSHPWQVGSGNLYSKEFFELVKSRLKPDGIYSQWVNLFRMDSDTLASVLKTFYDVFPQGVVFGVMRSGDLVLLGGRQQMVLDYERTKRYFQNSSVANMLRYGDLRYVEELPDYFLFTSHEARLASEGAEIATDANLLIEMRLTMPETDFRQDDDPFKLIEQYFQKNINQYKKP
ncbi:MAG: fused MFS/spermidine synthase [Hydrogenovibrio sp.]|uniref:fused MFS/spermidine synthase n=1 Tax=Hydrogenovibrio sp. TaxID=2065821 RepID=UPI00287031B7|nr:fused MFS/spermidine synthase [Hydrogenovibrio sp.]MDR9499651.1 fused MFS/spermidine synthase [Hydrogenovibrio sp.]